jgi:hypothetical protein
MRLTKLQKQMIADFTELEFGESIYVTKKNLQEKLRETNAIIKMLVETHIDSDEIEPVDESLLDSLEQLMDLEEKVDLKNVSISYNKEGLGYDPSGYDLLINS